MKKTTHKPSPSTPSRKWGFWWYLLLAILVIVLPMVIRSPLIGSPEISWQELETKVLPRNAVEKIVVVGGAYAEVYLKSSFSQDSAFRNVFKPAFQRAVSERPHYIVTIGSVETFDRKLGEAEQRLHLSPIPVTYEQKTNWFGNIIGWVIPLVLLIVFWRYLYKRTFSGTGGSSPFNFGKSTATLLDKENRSTVTFADVAGLEEAELEVREIVEFLKHPGEFTRLGAKIPKGVILVGPPGTGKTLLAKAVAGEAQVPFFSISGSEFVEMFVGVGASRVRDLFRQAKEKAPCIVFIDEIDAIGRSRSRNALFSGANDERESTLNQLLTEMDGFGTNTGVIVLAATNRADMLDAALLRPGRFDRHIYLELPNRQEREAIFRVHLRPLIMDPTIDTGFLAGQTPGFSGADIANICNEAALIAARSKQEKIRKQDFLEAIDRVIAGPEKKSKIISAAEKQLIAFHEAGHALVSWLLPTADPLIKVSIIPRGKSLGAAWYLPEEKQLRTRTAFFEHLCTTLGGRAAEELVFGEVSSGALDDLEKATKEAYMMVAYYGFNTRIGPVSFYDSTGRSESAFQKPYSEETARLVDEEVRKLVNEAYERSKAMLHEHRTDLEKIANLLLQKELIFGEDIESILGKRSIKETGTPVPVTIAPQVSV